MYGGRPQAPVQYTFREREASPVQGRTVFVELRSADDRTHTVEHVGGIAAAVEVADKWIESNWPEFGKNSTNSGAGIAG